MRISTSVFDVQAVKVVSKGLLDDQTETTDIEITTSSGDYRITLFHDEPLVISSGARHYKKETTQS